VCVCVCNERQTRKYPTKGSQVKFSAKHLQREREARGHDWDNAIFYVYGSGMNMKVADHTARRGQAVENGENEM